MSKRTLLAWLIEHALAEKTGAAWCHCVGVKIVDDDGWRHGYIGELPVPPADFNHTIMGLEEFLWRLSSSTIQQGGLTILGTLV